MLYQSRYIGYRPPEPVLAGGVQGERYISILVHLSVIHARLRVAGRTKIPTKNPAYAGNTWVMLDFMGFKIDHDIVMNLEACFLVIANRPTIVAAARPDYPLFLYKGFNAYSDLAIWLLGSGRKKRPAPEL